MLPEFSDAICIAIRRKEKLLSLNRKLIPMDQSDEIIAQTKKWINDVVIGCNFCPFAAKVVKQNAVYYRVENALELGDCLASLSTEFTRLDADSNIETSLLILTNGFEEFTAYLDLIDVAEQLLIKEGYEGIYQLASFHPQYLLK